MPKIIKAKKFRPNRGSSGSGGASTSDEPVQAPEATSAPVEGKEKLSRGQRKREKRKAAFLKKMAFGHEALKLQSMEEKKKGIGGLGTLSSVLPTASDTPVQASTKQVVLKTNKSKTRIAASEIKLLQQVHEHPAFQANPFAALQEHLTNTMASK